VKKPFAAALILSPGFTPLKDRSLLLCVFLPGPRKLLKIQVAEEKDIKRISQWTNRTNQFNLTTRRYSKTYIAKMLEDKSKLIYILALKDKFGDNGMVGVAIVSCASVKWHIDTF
jgi:FkbH-like protein